MHLTPRQLDRFYDLLDGLLVFANDRLHLVDGLSLPIVGEEAEMKAAFVCEALWNGVELIDEYARVNPHRLGQADLQAVLAWKDALRGSFTLVRHERGCAILLGEAGLFAVAGLDAEPAERYPQCPDMLYAVLLPFEGMVVTDGLTMADNLPFTAEELKDMEEGLERHCAEGIAWTAEEMQVRARAFNEAQRERELDALLASVELEARQARFGETLPEGWHRGVLAGLPADERERQVERHSREQMLEAEWNPARTARSRSATRAPSESLAECLAACLKKDELVELCRRLEVRGFGGKKKAALAELLVEPISRAAKQMEADLLFCGADEFELFRLLAQGDGVRSVSLADLRDYRLSTPLEPYCFQFCHEGRLVAVLPRELRPSASGIDFESLAYEREREAAAVHCAEAIAEGYGLLSLREAYELYCGVVVDALELDEFVALMMREDSYDDLGFVLQPWGDDSYLMHFSVSDRHLQELVMQSHEAETRRNALAILHEGTDGPTMRALAEKIAVDIEQEQAALDEYRRRVVESRSRTPRRPLDASAAEGAFFESLFDRAAIVQLRDFFDGHVPDAEDDYTFADRAVEDLVFHAIETGDANAYLDDIEKAGWNKCAEDEGLLLRLAENAYAALPSWFFNGWSPQEVMENVTGRKVFYNSRGEQIMPQPDDPCPCGSGKPYRSCHGG